MSSHIVDICRIEDIKPVEKADKLDVATVKGWQCIIGRDQHKIGDLVIFCPPDSIIPEWLIEKYKLEFLKKNGKVGTIKLRGQVSQGLILETDCLSQEKNPRSVKIVEGLNVAEVLGIKKWEPPERVIVQHERETIKQQWEKYKARKISFRRFIFKSFGLIKDGFKPKKKKLNPYFDKYTDIENLKNFPKVFDLGDDVVMTEKIHGSNFRAGNLKRKTNSWLNKLVVKCLGEYEFVYGSHTVQKVWFKSGGYYKDDIWLKIVQKYNLDKIIPKDTIIYGEVYGESVQDMTYGIKGLDCAFFDAKVNGKYIDYAEKVQLFQNLGLPMVPVVFVGKYSDDTVKRLTEGKSTICPTQIREGIVITPQKEQEKSTCGRKILKSISIEYLTRKNGTEFH